MITKETARAIYNCYQQIEEIDKIKTDMLEEIEKIRKRKEKDKEPIIACSDNSFGKYGEGMQLGIPSDSSFSSSMRIFSIPPEIGLMVMDEQRTNLNNELRELETIAKLEMGKSL